MKSKHLTLSDRIDIQSLLNLNSNFSYIARVVSRDRTTISKEVKKHRCLVFPSSFNNSSINRCLHYNSCSKHNVCNKACKLDCSSCIHCNQHCKEFSPILCERLLKAPYVCNGCSSSNGCRKIKYLYKPQTAHNEYIDLLSKSRSGLNSSSTDFKLINETVSALLKQGHSPYVIVANNPHLNISTSYIYRHIRNGLFSANLFDMPRILRFKPRKKKYHKSEYEPNYAKGRTYNDFLIYTTNYPDSHVVEMDCVEGVKGESKVFLTFYLRKANLLIIKVLDDHTNKSVVKAIEMNLQAKKRTSLYFCDPGASFQKGLIEEKHVLIRKVIPKGMSLSKITQSNANLLFNHINNYPTSSLSGITTMERAIQIYPKLFLDKLNCTSIINNNVILTKNLLKK